MITKASASLAMGYGIEMRQRLDSSFRLLQLLATRRAATRDSPCDRRYDCLVDPQTLLIDADDTLWENNIYFERAIANFISFLEHKEMTPQEVRGVLNEVEHGCVGRLGYGVHSFAQALVETFERLSVEPITPALHETIHGFARAIAEQPMEMIEHVEDTLIYLHARHRLILMTKGNLTEQSGKVERSGVRRFFDAIEIVSEKDRPTYENVAQKYGLVRTQTWMVGNSPKSDINPALAAGLNAVFIPHSETWVMEHAEIDPTLGSGTLLELPSFRALQEHF